MPSYLDFNSTKTFRDFIIGKTLNRPNGPQTFTQDNYTVQNTNTFPNIKQDEVDTNQSTTLVTIQNSNVYKPLEYLVKESFNTIPRKANLSLYWSGSPYFKIENHNLISILSNTNYENESELFRFAAYTIRDDKNGPIQARIRQNLEAATIGRIRLIDALNGNTATAINIVTGREPLVELNNKITVAKTLPGKGIDFLQTVAGVEFPWSEIPGDYLTDPRNPINNRPVASTEVGRIFQDVTGALGSLIGIQRRPKISRKPSDLMIEYLGDGQKNVLFDLLSYSTYAPNYTTTARSQNSSKTFNFIDNVAQGVKSILGMEAPKGVAYIGDDRGTNVYYAMNDFNDRPVWSNYYLSLMFDPVQAELFQRKRNYSENGEIGGKLTWISKRSKNKLGEHNKEWGTQESDINNTLSTKYEFREDSLLGYTQEILDSLPSDGGSSRSHVANVIDQTSRIFKEGDVLLSRGSAIQYVDKRGQDSGAEFCRVWTKDRAYLNYSDTMKRTGNIRKYEDSVMSTPWNLNIGPMSNGKRTFDGSTNMMSDGGDGFKAKKYMLSIENLVWKTSDTPGFMLSDLPYCERGPNNGRIMWFPPYDLKVSEQNNAKWESNTFLGRPEPIYTYQNTERSGQISFKIVVDHPSILNLLVHEHFKGMSDEESENYINAFFAGCEELDFYTLIRRYTTLTQSDAQSVKSFLDKSKSKDAIKKYRTEIEGVVENQQETSPNPSDDIGVNLNVTLNYPNDSPKSSTSPYEASLPYSNIYDQSIKNDSFINTTKSELEDVLRAIYEGPSKNSVEAKNDKNVLHGKTDVLPSEVEGYITTQKNELDKIITSARSGYDEYNVKMASLKTEIKDGTMKEIEVKISSATSAVADNDYNYKLSIRRSHSIFIDIITKISKDGTIPTSIKWTEPISGSSSSKVEINKDVTFKELGYEREGKITFSTSSSGEDYVNQSNKNCTNYDFKFVINEPGNIKTLKISSPIAFGCRQSSVNFKFKKENKQEAQSVVKPNNAQVTKLVGVDEVPSGFKKPAIDPMKRIIMKTLSECYYFQKVEESDPLVFKSLKEKLKYFHPGFHSTTPEGLNSRLTFLQQCIRPGETIPIKGMSDNSDLNARNTSFGPPPICILRVGDFYNSKIVIRDINITFDETTWDLNPEGIGVQPMIANVSLQINFIGGQGIKEPVNRLQNALSSNFYANTEMYDERSIPTAEKINGMDRDKFTTDFLEKLQQNIIPSPIPIDGITTNIVTEGYIGKTIDKNLGYRQLITDVYTNTTDYLSQYGSVYNKIVSEYGNILSTLILHPEYREVYKYDYHTSTGGSSNELKLFGQYPIGRDLSTYTNNVKSSMINTLKNINLSELFEFDRILPEPKQIKANQLLGTYLESFLKVKIDSMNNTGISDFTKTRNKLITSLDKVNFLVKYGYDVKVKDLVVTSAVLSGYTYNLIYNEYSNVLSYVNETNDGLYEDLDSTSINFKNPTISSILFGEILSVLLNKDKVNFMGVFKVDTTIFDSKTVEKLEKKFDKFISTPKDKTFKFKVPKEKKQTEISFPISSEVLITDENIKNEVTWLKMSGKIPIINNKLNYYKDE